MQIYKDAGYANNRLAGTIVRYNGRPINVMEIHGGKVVAIDILTGDQIVKAYDDKLDINPVPLGYVNTGTKAYYTARCPVRKDWKQGLRGNTFRAVAAGGGKVYSEMLNMTHVGQTILGDYPSFKKCVQQVKAATVDSIAFCRDLAIDFQGTIWLKGEYDIATVDLSTNKYKMKENGYWAEEYLKESGI